VADAGSDVVAECTSPGGARVTLSGSRTFDADGDSLTYTWRGAFPEGGGVITGRNATVTIATGPPVVITLTVDDGRGGTGSDTMTAEVRDTTAPHISVSLEPAILWPPDHKMVGMKPSVTVTDSCDASPRIALTAVLSSEPDVGTGDGDTANDIQGAVIGQPTLEFQLRAERSGGGPGRTYTVTYAGSDASGNATAATATAVVPHDKR
jgi:hypothetical protein